VVPHIVKASKPANRAGFFYQTFCLSDKVDITRPQNRTKFLIGRLMNLLSVVCQSKDQWLLS